MKNRILSDLAHYFGIFVVVYFFLLGVELVCWYFSILPITPITFMMWSFIVELTLFVVFGVRRIYVKPVKEEYTFDDIISGKEVSIHACIDHPKSPRYNWRISLSIDGNSYYLKYSKLEEELTIGREYQKTPNGFKLLAPKKPAG